MIRQQNIYEFPITTGGANGNAIGMNDLTYAYENDNGNSNLLKNGSDAVSPQNTDGFVDGNTSLSLDDYEYDQNGNIVKDRNKGITSIDYNHLNLPTKIKSNNSETKKIEYLYNAAGQKLQKKVTDGATLKEVDYLDASTMLSTSFFQYAGSVLQFFPHPEGYVKATAATPTNTSYYYDYVYPVK